MRVIDQAITTNLSTKELGSLFQDAALSIQGIFGRLAGLVRGSPLEFFTPRDDSPFSALNDDKPTFCIGAHIPSGGGSASVTVQMYIWDRQASRDVKILSAYSMGGGGNSRRALGRVVQAIVAADSEAQVTN